MAVAVIFELWRDLFADLHTAIAAGMEFAALRRIDRAGDIPAQNNAVRMCVRIGHGYGGKERFRIRVHGIIKDILRGGVLDKASQIHDAHIVGNVFDDGKVVRNKDVREVQLCL